MKLAVTRCDGDTEILILNDPVKVYEGTVQAHIHSAEGMDHYFRLSDGCYDGYSMSAPEQGWTEEQAKTMRDAVQKERLFIPLTLARFCELRLRRWYRTIMYWWGYLLRKPGYRG